MLQNETDVKIMTILILFQTKYPIQFHFVFTQHQLTIYFHEHKKITFIKEENIQKFAIIQKFGADKIRGFSCPEWKRHHGRQDKSRR